MRRKSSICSQGCAAAKYRRENLKRARAQRRILYTQRNAEQTHNKSNIRTCTSTRSVVSLVLCVLSSAVSPLPNTLHAALLHSVIALEKFVMWCAPVVCCASRCVLPQGGALKRKLNHSIEHKTRSSRQAASAEVISGVLTHGECSSFTVR